jgi:hypothetical protein
MQHRKDMSHQAPQDQPRKRGRRSNPNFNQKPTHWQAMWAKHPERLRQHIDRLTAARGAKAEERGRLIQAVFDMIPTEPMRPHELRDALALLWTETYGEPMDKKAAWNMVRSAQRLGMIGQTDDNLYFVRHSV